MVMFPSESDSGNPNLNDIVISWGAFDLFITTKVPKRDWSPMNSIVGATITCALAAAKDKRINNADSVFFMPVI